VSRNEEEETEMANALQNKHIAFLVANSGVEQVELTSPWQTVQDAGGVAELLAPEKDAVHAVHHDVEPGDTFEPDRPVASASVDEFD
jgi:protease I